MLEAAESNTPEDHFKIPGQNRPVRSPRPQFIDLICFLLLLGYCFAFYASVSEYWFNPLWTTDDARQQSFLFHEVYHPGVFDGDLIAESMRLYLPPLHYGINYAITVLTANPILTGHWV